MAKGMDGVAAPQRPVRTSGRSGLVGALESRTFIEADIDSIADNPRNPPKRIDPETLGVPRDVHSDDPEDGPRGLVASVVDKGVLEPLILISAAAWLAAYPDDVGAIGGADWVAPAGNRRKAAARAAREWATARVAKGEKVTIRHQVPGVVRDDLVSSIDEVLLHENSNRMELSPVDEARVYQRLSDAGMSQRAIAQALGLSQGQVAKRIKLLVLPDVALQLVDSGEVPVIDALKWTDAGVDVLEEFAHQLETTRAGAWWADRPQEGFNLAKTAVRQATALKRAQEEADKRGAQVMEDPYQALGRRHYYSAKLRTEKEIEAAAKAGTLAVAPDTHGGKVEYFTTAKPKRQTASEAEKAEKKARREADSHRTQFVLTIAKKKPTAGVLRDALVRALVTGLNTSPDSKRGGEVEDLAKEWCKAVGVGPDTATEYWRWRAAADANADHVAWITILAAYEVVARWEHASWQDSTVATYYRLLQDLGYQPAAWELTKLKKGRK